MYGFLLFVYPLLRFLLYTGEAYSYKSKVKHCSGGLPVDRLSSHKALVHAITPSQPLQAAHQNPFPTSMPCQSEADLWKQIEVAISCELAFCIVQGLRSMAVSLFMPLCPLLRIK